MPRKRRNSGGLAYHIILGMVLVVIVIGLAFFFLQYPSNSKEEAKKVLLIGIDGMDPKITQQLMDQGKLPNFQKLADGGSFMPLATSYPPHSPVAWTTIATGVNPGKHNIFDFIRRDPKNYLPQLSLYKTAQGISGTDYSSYVKAEPFWRKTSDAGIPTTIIRWPMTFPPERVEGKMLSGLGVPDVKGLLSGYTFYTSTDLDDDKVVNVQIIDGKISTEVYGPKIQKMSNRVSTTASMQIEVRADSTFLIIDDKQYVVQKGEWSEWINVEFKVDVLKKVHGIFKAYVTHLDPFEMYITTVNMDPQNPLHDITYPDTYSSDLASMIGLYYTLGLPEETDGFVDGRIDDAALLGQINEIEVERQKMFWKEFNEWDEGVLALVFDSSDRIQHVFWDEKLLGDDDGIYSINPAIVKYYEAKDRFIGKVLDMIDDDTLLIVFSDHGITSFERAFSLNRWLVNNGYMTLNKDIGEDEAPLFKEVDWSQTNAYAAGFNSLYINLKGREGQGIVENRESLVEELVEKLEKVVDPKTGETIINRAYLREEIYSGPYLSDAPDIVIGFKPGYRMSWQTAIGGFTADELFDNEKVWDGDHLVDPKYVPGVVFTNKKIIRKNVSQIDIMPTVLEYLGLSTLEMEGTNIFDKTTIQDDNSLAELKIPKITSTCPDCNVILISIDTLRADHLGCYGYGRDTSPNIDKFAKRSLLFEKSYSTTSTTLPTHASMFTGLYPLSHGVKKNGMILSDDFITLAELLQVRGYETAGIVSSVTISPAVNIHQGFNIYDYPQNSKSTSANILLERVQPWIEDNNQEKFFLFLHFFDPHSPYSPPEEYRTWGEDNISMYDGEILFVDDILGNLFELLEQKDLFDNSVIVFTSDHGESLGEKGFFQHGKCLYEECTHIPLIIYWPNITHQRGEYLASSIDLMPTIANILDINIDAIPQDGVNLLDPVAGTRSHIFLQRRLFDGQDGELREIPLSENYEFGNKYAARFGDWKYILRTRYDDALFNLQLDSDEKSNLISDEDYTEISDYLRHLLNEWINRESESEALMANQEHYDAIKSLGYLN